MHVDLCDPELFSSNRFWPVLAWLRANDPVHRHAAPDGDAFWVLSRYADIARVYADTERFSSRYGMRLGSNPSAISMVSQRMLIVSDPPDHTHLKRTLMRAFAPSEMGRIEGLVRGVVASVLADGVAAGEVDFIDVAKHIPNYVVCAMMGIPRSDWEYVGDLTTDAFESEHEDERSSAHGEIFLYFTELLAARRENPGDDLVSMLATATRALPTDGESRRLTDDEIVFNCNGVLAGANETTRYTTAGGVLAFIEHPDQWELLRAGGAAAVPPAAEEILRWTTPGVHALRTVLQPATIGAGVRVEPGERVTLWNVSANRDEDVFSDPHQFRIDRSPNRHITFGHGPHLCLGARLARLELGAFLAELLHQVEGFELVGQPRFNASNFTWGVNHLPVRLHPRRIAVRLTPGWSAPTTAPTTTLEEAS